jgi:KamA family protein
VILSGGDPLSLPDRILETLLNKLSSIPHVRRIRFHTRFPIGIPERINDSFLELIGRLRPQVWFVIHVNHPRELDPDILLALKNLQKLGIPILNQSVLLKGINDTSEVLNELCELLIDQGILPYYLHQLDRVQGAAHFEVSEERGGQLIREVTRHLSGYGVPKYVKEISGEISKTLL